MPDELQNVVPVMSATTMPAPPAMAALSSPPIRSALVMSISAGMVTTTTGARAGIRCLERPISKLTSGGSGWAQLPTWPRVMRGTGSRPMTGRAGLSAIGRPGSGHEPARPGQHHLQPRAGLHRVRGMAQLRPGPEANADGGQVLCESALVIVPEQRRPGDLPVPRQLGRKPVAAQRPQPVADPHARPARQLREVEV